MVFRIILPIFALFLQVDARNFEYALSPIRHLKMLEKTPKIQKLLNRLETHTTTSDHDWTMPKPKKLRKMHGVVTKDATSLLVSSSVPKSQKLLSMEAFEQELAQQIEQDEMKFVEDERNPMKYVVENGILYKQSKYSPLARLEIPPLPGMKMRTPTKSIRTSVFRGNINRQIPAIPLSTSFAINGQQNVPRSFSISNEITGPSFSTNSNCYINRFGYKCCDSKLESLLLKSFDKLKRKDANASISTISDFLKNVSRRVFSKSFEAIIGRADFDTTIASDFSCKIILGRENLIALVFVPALPSDRSNLLPYHELSREDIRQPVDLVVSKNGILVTKQQDDYYD